MCIKTQPAPRSATSPAMSGDPLKAVTSLTIDAPAASAARATPALAVSIETQAPDPANGSTTGRTRRSSSASSTGSAPGRVDSPPTSTTSAPLSLSRNPCFTAASASRNSPPSEKESGVTFTTPIRSGVGAAARSTITFHQPSARCRKPRAQRVQSPVAVARMRFVARVLSGGTMGILALLVTPQPALPAPRALSVSFESAPVVGRAVNLDVRAADRDAPVAGMVVAFQHEGIFGLSACRVGGHGARIRPFSPDSPARLSAPHVFSSTGPRPLLVRLDSGDCQGTPGSLLQPATVTPTPRGTPPIAITLGAPTVLAPGNPTLPTPGLPDLPGIPMGVKLPPLTIGSRSVASRLRLDRACPASGRQIGRGVGGHRAAGQTLLCLLNVVRRASGLRPLRDNSRLSRAAAMHSASMVRGSFFSHVEPNGVGLFQRLRRVHYIPRAHAWGAGENLGFG